MRIRTGVPDNPLGECIYTFMFNLMPNMMKTALLTFVVPSLIITLHESSKS